MHVSTSFLLPVVTLVLFMQVRLVPLRAALPAYTAVLF